MTENKSRAILMIVVIIYEAKIINTCWFQLLKCEDLLFFSVLYHCNLNIFGSPRGLGNFKGIFLYCID